MKVNEFSKITNCLHNTLVEFAYVQPLFDRLGYVNFTSKWDLLISEEETQKELNEHEIALAGFEEYKYVKIVRTGFNKQPYGKDWMIDTDFNAESEVDDAKELNSFIYFFATNDDEDIKILKEIEL